MANSAEDIEFDPCLNQEAQRLKDEWIAKYGKWEGDSTGYPQAECLRTALQAAGSIDPDKVAGVISIGLRFSGPSGTYQMISRPDLGNDRTVDCVW